MMLSFTVRVAASVPPETANVSVTEPLWRQRYSIRPVHLSHIWVSTPTPTTQNGLKSDPEKDPAAGKANPPQMGPGGGTGGGLQVVIMLAWVLPYPPPAV